MKSEVILSRNFNGHQVRQNSKTKYFNVTDLAEVVNRQRALKGYDVKRIDRFFISKDNQVYINELLQHLRSNRQNSAINSIDDLKTVKRGKGNAGTWVHPYLFTAIASWLSPEFRVMAMVWVTDGLVEFRNQSGDSFNELRELFNEKFGEQYKPWHQIKVANLVSFKVHGKVISDSWDSSTTDQLKLRDKTISEIITLLKFSDHRAIDIFLSYLFPKFGLKDENIVIKTWYKGIEYRSRLEARWAVFFDILGLKAQYEPEGYALSDGTWYLPDFYLPERDLYVEVKYHGGDFTKAVMLAENRGINMWLADGYPDCKKYTCLGREDIILPSEGSCLMAINAAKNEKFEKKLLSCKL